MKTYDKGYVFTAVNKERAKDYIGKKGYFSNTLFLDIESWVYGELESIGTDIDMYPFKCASSDRIGAYKSYKTLYFIPDNFVEEVQDVQEVKNYKPYDLVEFLMKYRVGDSFRLRRKDNPEAEEIGMFLGFIEHKINHTVPDAVDIGRTRASLDCFFKDYEMYDYEEDRWVPFGEEE